MSASPSKTGILLAAFGSASLLGERALSHFAQRVRLAFPDMPVRWAYTSDMMRNRLAAAGKKTDSVKKALRRMGFERYSHVAVQSLHLIPGVEYEALLEECDAAKAEGGPRTISVGGPLLFDEGDVSLAAQALLRHLPSERRPEEPVVCVGHGTWHTGAASYAALAAKLAQADPRIFIGTLSGEHSIDSILPQVVQSLEFHNPASRSGNRHIPASPEQESASPKPEKNMRRKQKPPIWLLPLLSIIGKHAEEDIAGCREDSWRGRFEAAGFTARPVLTGTVEYEAFAAIWLEHLGKALKDLSRG